MGQPAFLIVIASGPYLAHVHNWLSVLFILHCPNFHALSNPLYALPPLLYRLHPFQSCQSVPMHQHHRPAQHLFEIVRSTQWRRLPSEDAINCTAHRSFAKHHHRLQPTVFHVLTRTQRNCLALVGTQEIDFQAQPHGFPFPTLTVDRIYRVLTLSLTNSGC